jgi:hypothetical protein
VVKGDARLRGEQGFAIAAVLLLGTMLLMLGSVVVIRSLRQAGNVNVDAQWEQALAVAEAGLDLGLDRAASSSGFSTGQILPEFSGDPSAERAWIVDTADATVSSEVGTTPQGEFVILRPDNSSAIYSVGYVPSRNAEPRRVRVVRAQIGTAIRPGAWQARYAILTDGELGLNGNPTVVSGVTVGIHSNDYLSVGGSSSVDGCLSASGGARITGAVIQDPSCQPPGNQAPVTMPLVDVRSLWSFSQYDLCPSGQVRAGPAHPIQGHTVANEPCTGATLEADAQTSPFRNWRFQGCCDAKLNARWTYETDDAADGVYYIHEGSVDISSSPGMLGAPWEVTLLIEGLGTCPAQTGGDLSISGDPTMVPYSGTDALLAAIDRDLEITGNPDTSGLIAVNEQIKLGGTADVTEGAFLASNDCDSADDQIDENYVAGNTTITNSGPISSPFPGVDDVAVVVAWTEL